MIFLFIFLLNAFWLKEIAGGDICARKATGSICASTAKMLRKIQKKIENLCTVCRTTK